ncbi:MAG: cytochrome c biogenesis protein CcdA [Thermodesulfovibrionales bacterium]|nr:cytochrome c biogenesis protein CcdA [Thermodesulfovibrionales bacterium]
MPEVTYTIAFLAGIMSFLSPCVLPLVPIYVSVISGISLEDLRHNKFSFKTLTNTIAFITGFSTIFITLGASSSLIGNLLFEYQDVLRIIGGIFIIFLGFFMVGIIKPQILMQEKRFILNRPSAGLLSSFFIGIVFAAGWTPCIGPILGSILLYTATQSSTNQGLLMLTMYSLGLAIPFLLSSMLISLFFTYTRRISNFMKYISTIIGVIMIFIGLLILFDKLSFFSAIIPKFDIKY